MTDDEFEHRVQIIGYGPYLYEVCDSCNYNSHTCFFCGDDLTHSQDIGVNQRNSCYDDPDNI